MYTNKIIVLPIKKALVYTLQQKTNDVTFGTRNIVGVLMRSGLSPLESAIQLCEALEANYRAHTTAKPEATAELRSLTEQLHYIAGTNALKPPHRIAAMVHLLQMHILAQESKITGLKLRRIKKSLLPTALRVTATLLNNLQTLVPAASPEEQRKRYVEYIAKRSNATNEAKGEPDLPLNGAIIDSERKNRSALVLQRRSFHAKITRKNFIGRIKRRLQAAEDDALPTDATRRARYIMFHDEPIELAPYISLTDDDACIKATNNPIYKQDLCVLFGVNLINGRVYLHTTFQRILKNQDRAQRKDPITREGLRYSLILDAHSTTDIDCNEINRLLNLQRLRHPRFARQLHPHWLTDTGIDLLCRLHPRYIQPSLIKHVNHIAINNATRYLTQLNRMAYQLSTALLDKVLTLLSRHDVQLDRLMRVPPAHLRQISQYASRHRISLEQSIHYHARRANTKVQYYTAGLEGCAGFWRTTHKRQRLAHYRALQTATDQLSPLLTR
ncbi:MAG: hypothetical protein P1U63_03240 [Coxiellaceae bacterium]|nr:hypothetical protein [Coxiellaceae bacterium]